VIVSRAGDVIPKITKVLKAKALLFPFQGREITYVLLMI